MRIVHVTDSFAPRIGGIERQVEALARHQSAAGHDVTIVTGIAAPSGGAPSDGRSSSDGNASSESGAPPVGLATDSASAADPPADATPFRVLRPTAARWVMLGSPPHQYHLVRRALDRAAVDVVHAHFSLASPVAVRAARLANVRRIPVVVTVHSLWPSAFIVRGANQPLGLGPIQAAWSAVSTVATEDVRRILPRAGYVSVVPNIVDTRWWHRPGPARLGDPQEIRLVVVGRLARFKRVGELLSVLGEVRRRLDPGVALRVTIVGEGSRRPDLERQIAAGGMRDWVHLVGQWTPVEIRALLHESDLFIAPATRESFGIAALEARSAGLPVVGLTGTGLADFIIDGKEGVLAVDDATMGAALLRLCSEPGRLRELRDITTGTAPSIEAADAVEAVDRLYRRALPAYRPVADVQAAV